MLCGNHGCGIGVIMLKYIKCFSIDKNENLAMWGLYGYIPEQRVCLKFKLRIEKLKELNKVRVCKLTVGNKKIEIDEDMQETSIKFDRIVYFEPQTRHTKRKVIDLETDSCEKLNYCYFNYSNHNYYVDIEKCNKLDKDNKIIEVENQKTIISILEKSMNIEKGFYKLNGWHYENEFRYLINIEAGSNLDDYIKGEIEKNLKD